MNRTLNVSPTYKYQYDGLKTLTTDEPQSARRGGQALYIDKDDCEFKIVEFKTIMNPYV